MRQLCFATQVDDDEMKKMLHSISGGAKPPPPENCKQKLSQPCLLYLFAYAYYSTPEEDGIYFVENDVCCRVLQENQLNSRLHGTERDPVRSGHFTPFLNGRARKWRLGYIYKYNKRHCSVLFIRPSLCELNTIEAELEYRYCRISDAARIFILALEQKPHWDAASYQRIYKFKELI